MKTKRGPGKGPRQPSYYFDLEPGRVGNKGGDPGKVRSSADVAEVDIAPIPTRSHAEAAVLMNPELETGTGVQADAESGFMI